MKYHIDTKYAWYDHEGEHLVLLYLIQNIPFTFDELPEVARQNPSVIQLANSHPRLTAEDLYKSAMYLMMEEWRWSLTETTIMTQHTGGQKELRCAMNDVAKTVEYILDNELKEG